MLLEDAEQIITGALFGAALTTSGVFLPSIILEQFDLKNFYMLQVFATAVGSSALVMLALEKLGFVQRPVKPNAPLGSRWTYGSNLVGGAMVGTGMALTGACLGTVLVQLAQGIPSARPTALGALLGGMAYCHVSPKILPRLRPQATDIVKRTIPQAGIHEGIVYAILGIMTAGLLLTSQIWLPATGPWSSVGGLAIGGSQAVSLLLTSAPLGVSTAYEDAGRYILQTFHIDRNPKPSKIPKAIVIAAAISASSVALGKAAVGDNFSHAQPHISVWQALIGGFIMVFGARLGGGCTSGHGLSGVSALSMSSLVTLAGIFGAGILVRLLMQATLRM
ncbi:hypothetical protein LTR78_010953 [Recurvomyces mirabilis]|uniref:Sulphur transport domain-containing protein n=1 Tax=Recurvomyces mirabilis TaxID=574656 RepID=A0AAE0TLZ4_9PEZI|nr:hypothetical protein LTR78_010953 [Recurvomyces mirabilis]KAK5149470.1 hypothetical protein LTS14_010911 [Recurvomyces mirabilis]